MAGPRSPSPTTRLCLVAGRAADGGTNTVFAVTVSIAVEFLDAGRVGLPLEASGEPLAGDGPARLRARQHHPAGPHHRAVVGRVPPHTARPRRWNARRRPSAAAPLVAQSVPAGFELLSNASVYSRHIGPSYARKEADGASLVQPTLPHMCNSGGVLHGGYMMSFADSAVTRAAGLTTGMAPSTVAFAAEFLSAGTATTPIATRVEVPRHGKSLAFVRGLLEQDGRKLLSYSATIKLRPRS